jgi:hypothetical protein
MQFIDENHYVCIKNEHKRGEKLQWNQVRCKDSKKEMTEVELE